jgi:hypothetical protein
MLYTTQDLIESIKLKSFSPGGQRTFTDEELLAIAGEKIRDFIMPAILGASEEYFVYKHSQPLVYGQAEYPFPDRSFNSTARDLYIFDSTNQNKIIIERTNPEKVTDSSLGNPGWFYIENDNIVLDRPPIDVTNKVLVISYFIRHADLIAYSADLKIAAITNNTIEVNQAPIDWVIGNRFDVISQSGSHSYKMLSNESTNVNGNIITFMDSIPSSVKVGDILTLENTNPLVSIPTDFRSVLAQAVAGEILSNMNQPSGAKAVQAAERLLSIQIKKITPRVKGKSVQLSHNWF